MDCVRWRSKVGADGAIKERIWSGICYPVEDIIPMPTMGGIAPVANIRFSFVVVNKKKNKFHF